LVWKETYLKIWSKVAYRPIFWRTGFWLFLLLSILSACQVVQSFEQPTIFELSLAAEDRILVLAPHPDDEVLGAGGVIQQAVEMQLPLQIVFLTAGDFNEWSFMLYRRTPSITPTHVRQMGVVRINEAIDAAAVMGVAPEDVIFLGYPDSGTLDILYRHWGEDRPPYRGWLTRSTAVPYEQAFRQGAPYKGEEILQDLKTILRDFRPTKIFVSHPADHHPDHRSLYIYLRVALWDLADEIQATIYPYLVHYPNWPHPTRYEPTAQIAPPTNLGGLNFWWGYTLTEEQVDQKLVALRRHVTQYGSAGRFLSRFVRTNEIWGDYPVIRLLPDTVASLEPDVDPDLPPNIPEQLTEEEEEVYVEVEEQSVRLVGETLVVTIELSRPLERGANASLFLFGYHPEHDFVEMPKIQVRMGYQTTTIYDQNRRITAERGMIQRTSRRLVARIPLAMLGDPDRIIMSGRTYLGRVPLDWAPLRVVEIVRE
jgi:LmbE family N-acetylglucosaminyl deacetylase